ncbi:MAG: GNAT family N-acetyltransferase [Bryobacterales bacterium]|nr:GNAT family N-acetyltransferase [Bryobacterales bacterium]
MPLAARLSELEEIAPLRVQYTAEMNCQVIHHSIHSRLGWTQEYAIEVDGTAGGYGSVAVAGPWQDAHTLYEFYVVPELRTRVFEIFEALLAASAVTRIETQTNDALLTTMLHTYAGKIEVESILFEDAVETTLEPGGASVRHSVPEDVPQLKRHELDDAAGWVMCVDGEIAGAGGVLYHYNRPYGDVYMRIAERFRKRGLGAFLVQELKAACRRGGSVPAARCNVANVASRRTLQKAGFVPCGNLITGEVTSQ